MGTHTLPCILKAEQIFKAASGGDLQISDFCLDPLKARYQARNIFSEEIIQVLKYSTSEDLIGLIDDDNMRNGVRHAQRKSQNYLRFMVRTQDDIGGSISRFCVSI